jgi:hypothetical protein
VKRVQILVALGRNEWDAIKRQIPGIRRLEINEKPVTHQAQLLAELREQEDSFRGKDRQRLIVVTPPLDHGDVEPMCTRLLMEFPPRVDIYVVFEDRIVRYRSQQFDRRALPSNALVNALRRLARRAKRKT